MFLSFRDARPCRRGLLLAALASLALAAALATPGDASARKQLTVQTFDEWLPGEPETSVPVHGLHYKGVTFSFTRDGVPVLDTGIDDIVYHGYGPRYPDYALGGGTDGVLELAFDRPTRMLEFEMALSISPPLDPGATITLRNRHGRTIETLTPAAGSTFSKVSYRGRKVATATFEFNTGAWLFAIDNLTYVAAARHQG